MNSTYLTIITTIVRQLIMWLMGALLTMLSPKVYNLVVGIITELGGTEVMVTAIAGTVGSVLLALYLKIQSKYHLKIALALPKGSTIADVQDAAEDKSSLSVLRDPPR